MMEILRKRIQAKQLLPMIGSVLLVAFLFHRIDIDRLVNLRRNANWPLILASASLTLPFLLIKAQKWLSLLQTAYPGASYPLALRSFLLGMGASLFLPARLGEFARAACFPKQPVLTLTLVGVDKLIDITVLLGLFSLSLASVSFGLGLAGLGAVTGFWLVIFLGLRLTKATTWILRKPWFAAHLRRVRHLTRQQLLMNGGSACVCFGVMMFQFYLLLSSFQPVGWQTGLTLPIILVASSIPISMWGLGVREGVAALLLSQNGVATESAVTAAFLLFIVNSLLPGLVGLVISPTLLQPQRLTSDN